MRAIGGIAQIKEECRDMRKVNLVENLIRDVRYAGRMFRKSPGFTAIAVLSLALGIGANTAIFSLINAVLLRRLPVRQPEQLVLLTSFLQTGKLGDFATADYLDLRDHSRAFSGFIASSHIAQIDVGFGGQIETAQRRIVSGISFPVLGVGTALGRPCGNEGDGLPVVVIQEGSAEGGSDAQDGKVIPGNDPALSGFDLPSKSNIDLGDVGGRDKTGEGAAMIAQIQIISGCKVTELTRLKKRREQHQLLRLADWKASQENGVHQAENRGICANT